MSLVLNTITEVQSHGAYPNILGFGDFNFPQLKWTQGALPPPQSPNSQLGTQCNAVLSMMRDHLLYQAVTEPTRLDNILDLVFTNNQSLINGISHQANVEFSDHNTLNLRMNIFPGQICKKPLDKSYYQTDLYKLNMRRNTPVDEVC